MEQRKMISVSDASTILRVSDRQIRRYCADSKLVCEKRGTAFEVDLASVLNFLQASESEADTIVKEDDPKNMENNLVMSVVPDKTEDVPDIPKRCPQNVRDLSPEPPSPRQPTPSPGRASDEARVQKNDANPAQLREEFTQIFQEIQESIEAKKETDKEFFHLVGESLRRLDAYLCFEEQRYNNIQDELSQLFKFHLRPVVSSPEKHSRGYRKIWSWLISCVCLTIERFLNLCRSTY